MAIFTNTAATTAAVSNRFVTTTLMSLTPYTIANASPVWSGGCLVTILHATTAGTDTLGTVTIVGTDLLGQAQTEVITPLADQTVTGTKIFRTITSATSTGWVAVSTADNITIGCAAGNIACGSSGKLYAVVINTTAAATVVVSDGTRTIATLKASIAEGTYLSTPVGIDISGYLKVATTSTNDVTLIHTQTLPQNYATS